MKKDNDKRIITRDELTRMKEVDIRTVDPLELVDIEEVIINKELPYGERMYDYIRQIKNPYCYRCNGMIVKISFSGQQSLEDCLKAAMSLEKYV